MQNFASLGFSAEQFWQRIDFPVTNDWPLLHHPTTDRDLRQVTCPAKAYQVEVEETACVIRLRPV